MEDDLKAKSHLEEKGAIFDFDEEIVYMPEQLYISLSEKIKSLNVIRNQNELRVFTYLKC